MYAFDKHSTVRGWYYPFYSVHHDTQFNTLKTAIISRDTHKFIPNLTRRMN